ncbi:Isethionate sulfite-lyase [Frankliniella fusca]|uniref:Isethionate sulfite-lyase n=1 Tax=Frankliniella fusca TaxID=407009 RepID=A0AAE1LBU6_9NEOP|nr:Isethionate sulfite-lyase [Frankliniella fusca]
MVYCAHPNCQLEVRGGLQGLKDHIINKHHAAPFLCYEEQCSEGGRAFNVKSSFIRHLQSNHPLSCDPGDDDESMDTSSSSNLQASTVSRESSNYEDNTRSGGASNSSDENEENAEMDVDDGDHDNIEDDFSLRLEESAARFVLNIRRHGNVTATTVQRIMSETFELLNTVLKWSRDKISSHLTTHEINEDIISKCVDYLHFEDPFMNLKTTEKQLDYFEEKFGLVRPERDGLFLGTRWEDKLDKQSGLTLPVQVRTTFQYVPLIKQLTAILNNPVLFNLIHKETPSTDGHYRSYLDGSEALSHPLVSRYPNIIRLVKWVDDSEVVNPLGSKTAIHKIVNDLFVIHNLPPEENARLRSIHLSSYSYREDLPEDESVDALLAPFFNELDQLESEEGVSIQVNNAPFTLRATLTAFAADDLGAHELLGLGSPSLNRFCTLCLITRHEFHSNIFAMGAMRTKEMHRRNVEELNRRGAAFALASSGVKRDSILTRRSKYTEFPAAMIKDPMHDLLRGIAPMEVKLVLHELCIAQKYFSIEDFNAQLKSFNYGIADMKNKPSPNITKSSLQKPMSYVMHQTAAQTWCLIRVFPFIVRRKFPKVPQNCPHVSLIVLLKRLCDIIFSDDISENDLILLEELIHQHHTLFVTLYPLTVFQEPEIPQHGNQVDEDFLEDEEEVDNPSSQVCGSTGTGSTRKTQSVVRPLQKHHSLVHYPELIRKFGPIVLYWCMSKRNALLKRFGAICNNFIRLPLTFANLHQISHTADFLDWNSSVKSEISFPRGGLKPAGTVFGFPELADLGIEEDAILQQVSEVTVGGFRYIVDLYVALPLLFNENAVFGKIRNVYIFEYQPFLVCEEVKTIYDEDFGAYKIDNKEPDVFTIRAFKQSSLLPVRPMSIWQTADGVPYLSPRNAIGDMLINITHADELE